MAARSSSMRTAAARAVRASAGAAGGGAALAPRRRAMTTAAAAAQREEARRSPRRAVMYVPGSSEKMLRKAAGLTVDTVCLDMEDGVAASKKAEAREGVVAALTGIDYGATERLARINAVGTGLETDDARAVLSLPAEHAPDGIVLPKADSPDMVRWLAGEVERSGVEARTGREMRIILLIESATAVIGLHDILRADRRVDGVIFGADDFAATVGATRSPGNAEVSFARNMTLLHARAAGLHSVTDVVQINYKNGKLLEEESRDGFRLGFTGKQVIHPSQIAPVQQAFSPAEADVAWARRLLVAFDQHSAGGKGAFSFDNKMIDMPTVLIARGLVERADACAARL